MFHPMPKAKGDEFELVYTPYERWEGMARGLLHMSTIRSMHPKVYMMIGKKVGMPEQKATPELGGNSKS